MLKYRILELKESSSPVDNNNDKWFYYEISNQVNTISGYREGNKKEIEHYLKETLSRLNNKFKLPAQSYQKGIRKAYEPGAFY